MALDGSDVYKRLQAKERETKVQHDSLNADLYRTERGIETLATQREEKYSTLAETYLPTLDAQSLSSAVRELREEVQGIFHAKQERRAELDKTIARHSDRKASLENDLAKIADEVNEKEGALENSMKTVHASLSEEKEYVTINEQGKTAAARLKESGKRYEEFSKEAEQKLVAYTQDPLFSYLLKRGYGTEQYRASGIGASLDKKVAKVVRFWLNKDSYDILTKAPAMLKEKVAEQQKTVDDLAARAQAMERAVEEKHGVPILRQQLEHAQKDKAGLVSEMQKVDTLYNEATAMRSALDTTKDEYHKDALSRLKGYLKGQDIQELKARARATPDTKDDMLVREIENADGEIRRLKTEASSLIRERDICARQLSGLADIVRQYSRKDYDGRRSRFNDSFDIDALLIGYLAGHLSSDHVAKQIDTNQYFKSEPTYSHSSSDWSSSSSSSSHHSSGGGFSSSDSFSSGGGFDSGGGFSSGGSF